MLLFEFSSEHVHSTGYHYERAFVRLVIDKVCRRILACLTCQPGAFRGMIVKFRMSVTYGRRMHIPHYALWYFSMCPRHYIND